MITITGDIHGGIDIGKLNASSFPASKDMTKKDYVIILGDFGLVWDGSNEEKYWLKWLQEKPFTTLFLDGNHENHPMLNALPVEEMFGGNVHRVNDSVFHLMRGNIFTIEDDTFFVMGGAKSTDKMYRIEGKSWWPEELPSSDEINFACDNLQKANWTVDFILSHCAPNSIAEQLCYHEKDVCTNFLQAVLEQATFTAHFFGHYHMDTKVTNRHFAVYNKLITLK